VSGHHGADNISGAGRFYRSAKSKRIGLPGDGLDQFDHV